MVSVGRPMSRDDDSAPMRLYLFSFLKTVRAIWNYRLLYSLTESVHSFAVEIIWIFSLQNKLWLHKMTKSSMQYIVLFI